MEKIEILIPEKIQIPGARVIITKTEFESLISTINTQTTVINALIDTVSALNEYITAVDGTTQNLQNAIQSLANAVTLYSEDK